MIVHCRVKRDVAKCRDAPEARLPKHEHLVLTAGRSGPAILIPRCIENIRPDEDEHEIVRGYMSGFSDTVPVHDADEAELMVWTTTSRALFIGAFSNGSQRQKELIQNTIAMRDLNQADNTEYTERSDAI